MRRQLTVALIATLILVALASARAAAQDAENPLANLKWQPLWNGQDLKGWHEIGKGKWTVEDGAIVGRHEAKEDFGHLVTDATYKDFLLRLKFKSVKGNSGLYFRIEEKGGSGVTGFQAEIDPVNDVGGLYETNGRAWVVQPKADQVKTWFKPQDWNDMVVAALGHSVYVFINGKMSAMIVNDPGRTEGKIALQLHGGQDGENWFKDIAIIEPTGLLPGPDMAGFKKPCGDWAMVGEATKDPANEKALAVKPGAGVITNGPKGTTANLFTEGQFGDSIIHVEFMIPKGSNSGVYVMGRYEVQVYDSFGVEKGEYPGIECGGIYQRWKDDKGFEGHSPAVNASLAPGQWQTFDIHFQAPRFDADGKKTANGKFIKILHNGKVVHEDVEVTGPTRGAAFEDEKPTGPIMFQGDHGPVAYRNLCVMPLGK